MAQYTSGTVSVTTGSQLVTGDGTKWKNVVRQGDMFAVSGNSWIYEIAHVASDTELYLSTAYTQLSNSGATYAVIRDFTPFRKYPELKIGDREPAAIISKAFEMIDDDIYFLRSLKFLEAYLYDYITVSDFAETDARQTFEILYISESVSLYLNALEISDSITVSDEHDEFQY